MRSIPFSESIQVKFQFWMGLFLEKTDGLSKPANGLFWAAARLFQSAGLLQSYELFQSALTGELA